jgi:hypothetical protein
MNKLEGALFVKRNASKLFGRGNLKDSKNKTMKLNKDP